MAKNNEIPEKFKHLDWQMIAEELCEAICGNERRVQILDIFWSNRLNSSGKAVFNDENGEEIVTFCFRNGDWGGTEIFDVDAIEKYQEPKPVRRTFVPDIGKTNDPEFANRVYSSWKETEWFKQKVKDMNYDLYFEPTEKTKKHYRDWAASKGMRIEIVED